MKCRFLVVYRPGPNWVPGRPTSEQPLKEHGKYMLDLFIAGAMKFAGPFAEDAGGAAVIEAECEADARALATGDPAVQSRIFTHEIHRWDLVDWERHAALRGSANVPSASPRNGSA